MTYLSLIIRWFNERRTAAELRRARTPLTVVLFATLFIGFLSRVTPAWAAAQPIRVLFAQDPPVRLANFLDYANIPYDVQTSFSVEDVLGQYSAIITTAHVTSELEATIQKLVAEHGVGLVYCNWNSTSSAAHDPTLINVFNVEQADYVSGVSPSGTVEVTDASHFITRDYVLDTSLTDTYSSQVGRIVSYTSNGDYPKFLAEHSGTGDPALIINQYGIGRAAWFNFRCDDATNAIRQGYSVGAFLNALIWTSEPIVGKHFAFSTIPTYLTMRVDDVEGDFEKMFAVSEAHGLKLTNLLFTDAVHDNPAQLAVLQEYYAKNHGMGVHAPNSSEHYFWRPGGISESEIVTGFDEFQRLFQDWGFRQPTTFVPSQYRLNDAVFPYLATRGLRYFYGYCAPTSDGTLSIVGQPFGDTLTTHLDQWTALSDKVWCFTQRHEGGESLSGRSSLAEEIARDRLNLEWAVKNHLPAILYSHEYLWQNFDESYLSAWLDGLVDYLDTEVPGWNSLAGDFLAPIIVAHKDIAVEDASFDPDAAAYQIRVSGANAVPVPITIYEPEGVIAYWDGLQQVVRNGDFYHLFIPAGSGERNYTVQLAKDGEVGDFAYIERADTLVEATEQSEMALRVDLFDFGTLWLRGNGGHVTSGETTIQPNGSFSGRASISDGAQRLALLPMTIQPNIASLSASVEVWEEERRSWIETSLAVENEVQHRVGELTPGEAYRILVDGLPYLTQTADDKGELGFIYRGGYSEHRFELLPVTKQAASGTITSVTSANDCQAALPASPPELYAAIAQGPNQIELYFAPGEGQHDHYALEYGTETGTYRFGTVNIGGRDARIYMVKSLSPDTTYYFRLRSGNGCASGPWSNELAATTQTVAAQGGLQTKIVEWQTGPRDSNQQDSLSNGQRIATPANYEVLVKVVNVHQQPVVNALVTLHSTPRSARTDDTGTVHFREVTPGHHELVIVADGYEGRQSLHLSGDERQIALTIQVEPPDSVFRPSVVAGTSLLGLIILVFMGKFMQARRTVSLIHIQPRQALMTALRRWFSRSRR